MSANRTSRLIDELAADLAPVAPLPPLRVPVIAVLALGLAVVAGVVALNGGVATPRGQPVDETWLGVLVALAIVAVSGSLAGLASAIPGRDAARNLGAGLAALAAAAGLAVGIAALDSAATRSGELETQAAHCFGAGLALAIGPVLLGFYFARRSWVLSLPVTAPLLLLGTTAIGALGVHLTCPLSGALHVLLGHHGIPLLTAAVSVPLVALWLRRSG